jgi:hypothetical protein
MAFPDTFRSISAIHVIHHTGGNEGGLDKLLVAGTEGVTLLWWEMSRWHVRNIGPTMVRTPHAPAISGCGLVCVGNIGESLLYIVSSEVTSSEIICMYITLAKDLDSHSMGTV